MCAGCLPAEMMLTTEWFRSPRHEECLREMMPALTDLFIRMGETAGSTKDYSTLLRRFSEQSALYEMIRLATQVPLRRARAQRLDDLDLFLDIYTDRLTCFRRWGQTPVPAGAPFMGFDLRLAGPSGFCGWLFSGCLSAGRSALRLRRNRPTNGDSCPSAPR